MEDAIFLGSRIWSIFFTSSVNSVFYLTRYSLFKLSNITVVLSFNAMVSTKPFFFALSLCELLTLLNIQRTFLRLADLKQPWQANKEWELFFSFNLSQLSEENVAKIVLFFFWALFTQGLKTFDKVSKLWCKLCVIDGFRIILKLR